MDPLQPRHHQVTSRPTPVYPQLRTEQRPRLCLLGGRCMPDPPERRSHVFATGLGSSVGCRPSGSSLSMLPMPVPMICGNSTTASRLVKCRACARQTTTLRGFFAEGSTNDGRGMNGPGGIAVRAGTSSVLLGPVPRLTWYASTTSLIGLYAVHPTAQSQLNELLVVLRPEALTTLLDEPQLPKGVPLLKHAVALLGQTVLRSDRTIIIDGIAVGRRSCAASRSLVTRPAALPNRRQ
jgi:hypothetical protein